MKTYIIHVSDAYERKEHIAKQIANKNLSHQYITDGDMSTLNKTILNNYFAEKMHAVDPRTSCAYKHILAYKKIINSQDEYALILEDDITLSSEFEKNLQAINDEINNNNHSSFFISIEDSNLKYVEKSIRKPDVYLYPKSKGRLAGAYIIDYKTAESILNYIEKYKCDQPIDWFHNTMAKNKAFDIYWSHPTIACQGSLRGNLKSLIDGKSTGIARIAAFKIQKVYKKLLYNFR